ncbi:MAG: M28 family metallopeptidase [Bryobacteraceae bacterium]
MNIVFDDEGALGFLYQDHAGDGFLKRPFTDDLLGRLRKLGHDVFLSSGALGWPPKLIALGNQPSAVLQSLSPTLLHQQLKNFNLNTRNSYYVSHNAYHRRKAADSGMTVVPSPLLVLQRMEGFGAYYVRISPPLRPNHPEETEDWWGELRDFPLVPLLFSSDGPHCLYAIASEREAESLDSRGFRVDRLGARNLPDFTSLILARPGRRLQDAEERENTPPLIPVAEVLSSIPDGLLIALRGGAGPLGLPFQLQEDGDVQWLSPNYSLLQPVEPSPPELFLPEGSHQENNLLDVHTLGVALTSDETSAFLGLTAATLSTAITPFASPNGTRYLEHLDQNRAAVRSAITTLRSANLVVPEYGGIRVTYNDLIVSNAVGQLHGQSRTDVVILAAHLDTIASNELSFLNNKRPPVPGVDDDATGMAAVLCAAGIISRLAAARQPRRSIHFVLFNAEEVGMVGSQVYLDYLQTNQVRVHAMIQLDMIGYRPPAAGPAHPWEIHCGHRVSATRDRCVQLATVIDALRPALASTTLQAAQKITAFGDSAEKSDHLPFQNAGIAACCLSENFTAGPGVGDPEEGNPHYHTRQDTLAHINFDYAAAIARVAAAAAWLLAK